MDQDSREQYQHFLLHSNVATDLYEFRDEGGLRMVSLVDGWAMGCHRSTRSSTPVWPG